LHKGCASASEIKARALRRHILMTPKPSSPLFARKNFWRDVDPAEARSSSDQGGRCGLKWIKGDKPMRVMVLVKATKDSEAGIMPSTELLEAMGKYNEELVNAGILLAGEGLHPSAKGKRVAFDGPSRTVIDGPFAETRELIAGFWLWQVKDVAEAVEWVKRCPNPMLGPSEIEIRPVFDMADFGDAVTPEVAELHERTREKAARR
jgi:hypothetical protein